MPDHGPGTVDLGAAWTHETASPWVTRWDAVMTGYWPWRHEADRLVLRLLRELGAHGRVLEIGCGPGNLAAELARSGCDVVAMDWDPLVLALARAHLDEVATVWEADVMAPGWGRRESRGFDAVVTTAVMHVLDASEYASVAVEVARVLRPGGVFVDTDEMPLPPAAGRLGHVAADVRQGAAQRCFEDGQEDFATWMQDLRAQPESAELLELQHRRIVPRPHARVARSDERAHALRRSGFSEVAEVERRFDTAMLVGLMPR